MPTSAQSRCLPATYQVLPGSLPTRTVASPGVTPCSASLATRSRSSALIAAAVALPSRSCAVTCWILSPRDTPRPPWTSDRSVEEVARAGEVHGDSCPAGRLDDLLVADRAAGLDHSGDAGLQQQLEPVGEGEERVARRDRTTRPLPCSGDREPAGVDAVDLTHPDPDRGAVRGQQDRVGLHGAAGDPRE